MTAGLLHIDDVEYGDEATYAAQFTRFTNALHDELDESYDLIYVDYRDELSETQVQALLTQDWETFDEGQEEWESDSRHHGARYELETLSRDVAARFERETDIDDLADELLSRLDGSQAEYDLLEEISDRDSGGWLRELVANTGRVFLRIPLDDDGYDDAGAMTGESLCNGLGMALTPGNIDACESILAECGDGPKWPFLLAYVDLVEIYDAPTDAKFDLVDPHLFLTNIYAGDGWEHRVFHTFRVSRDRLMTDKAAPGYGWDEIAGVVKSAYEIEIRPVPNESTENTEEVA